MSNILNGFSARDHKAPTTDYEPLPDGWYLAQIDQSETKPTKKGDGHYLELTFVILEGEHRDRRVWDRLNLDNPNATAVAIAQQSLAAICHAVGVLDPREPEELHDRPLRIRVAYVPPKGPYAASNAVKGYKAASDEPAKEAKKPKKAAPVTNVFEAETDGLPF